MFLYIQSDYSLFLHTVRLFFLNLEILLEARCFLIGISVNLIGNINTHANHVQAAVPFKSWVSFHP